MSRFFLNLFLQPCFRRTLQAVLPLLLLAAAPLSAQLVRQNPAGLNFPAQLPTTEYDRQNALVGLVFNQPVAIASPPGDSSRVFVVERTGTIQVVRLSSLYKQTFLDVRHIAGVGSGPNTNFVADGESGLLGLAFHPNYAVNRTFFIFYSVRINGQAHQRLARLRTSVQSDDLAEASSHEPLITQYDESSNHNGGDLHFGPDGYLYVSLGDEGGAYDSYDNARWVDRDFHAALLRLDVDRLRVGQAGGSREPNPHPAIDRDSVTGLARYAIPPDNPLLTGAAGTLGPIGAGAYPSGGLLDAAKLRTEFYAYGLRNPWRFSFDPPTGRLFVADVGQDRREEIDLVTKGANLGWPYREGTIAGPRSDAPATPLSPRLEPIHDYPQWEGYSITGGRIYRGTALPGLYGAYVFADFSGFTYALREGDGGWTRELLYRSIGIVGIGRDPRNEELLFADIYSGQIHKLVHRTRSSVLPQTLSQTGLFSDVASLVPAAGVVPYDVNHPAWNDHARARHWFTLPGAADSLYAYALSSAWTLPSGAVWVQHLDLDLVRGDAATARKVETRVLVKTSAGSYGATYRWREDQSDADLVAPEGEEFDLTVSEDGLERIQHWRIPGWTQCQTCHSPAAGDVLSFNAWQLNRQRDYGGGLDNQINHFVSAGYFASHRSPSRTEVAAHPAHAALDDTGQSLEHRLRSYLAVNCASCHRSPDANAATFSVLPALTTVATGLRTARPDDLGDDPEAMLLAPGSPEHSMLLRRLLGDGVARMPPIGPHEIDRAAETLLRAYIAELPSLPLYDDWHHSYFDGGVPAHEADTDPDGDAADNRLEYLGYTSPVVPQPDPLNLRVEETPAGRSVKFRHAHGRALTIELSENDYSWQRWVEPDGGSGYPATDLEREVFIPGEPWARYVRVRLEER